MSSEAEGHNTNANVSISTDIHDVTTGNDSKDELTITLVIGVMTGVVVVSVCIITYLCWERIKRHGCTHKSPELPECEMSPKAQTLDIPQSKEVTYDSVRESRMIDAPRPQNNLNLLKTGSPFLMGKHKLFADQETSFSKNRRSHSIDTDSSLEMHDAISRLGHGIRDKKLQNKKRVKKFGNQRLSRSLGTLDTLDNCVGRASRVLSSRYEIVYDNPKYKQLSLQYGIPSSGDDVGKVQIGQPWSRNMIWDLTYDQVKDHKAPVFNDELLFGLVEHVEQDDMTMNQDVSASFNDGMKVKDDERDEDDDNYDEDGEKEEEKMDENHSDYVAGRFIFLPLEKCNDDEKTD